MCGGYFPWIYVYWWRENLWSRLILDDFSNFIFIYYIIKLIKKNLSLFHKIIFLPLSKPIQGYNMKETHHPRRPQILFKNEGTPYKQPARNI